MKVIMVIGIGFLYFFTTTLGLGGVRKQLLFIQEYKDAVDAGAYAASKHTSYSNEDELDGFSFGFGEGFEHKNNIPINPLESLEWFYEIFFRNLGIENNLESQKRLKSYLPMKAVVSFDRIQIIDHKDHIAVDEQFLLDYRGKDYLFTLSNQIRDEDNGEWLQISDLGMTDKEKQAKVTTFVIDQIETFLANRENSESNMYYTLNIALDDMDPGVNGIKGINFIVLSEGLPIPSMNVFEPTQKIYAFSFGGSEITRR